MNKVTSIAHSIITATRPKSFVSPLLLAISTYIHRKFESKLLVNILSKLGFCETYDETLRYEASATMQGQADLQPVEEIFLQYAFDNADYDVHTIDGKNTFHYTGDIECITPDSSVPIDLPIIRLEKMPGDSELAAKGSIPITNFDHHDFNGLSTIKIKDLEELRPCPLHTVQLLTEEIVWIIGKWLNTPNFPEWNGFMEYHTAHREYKQTAVKFLPFINLKSSDDNALYTALTFACNQIKRVNQSTAFITFDQPLYIKARNIVATIIENNKKPQNVQNKSIINNTNIVVKLRGFHLLMSFLGSIGYIMQGSGLKEAWASSNVYAEQSIDNMMNGKHYSRAMRAHLLTQSALIQILLDESRIPGIKKDEMSEFLQSSRKKQTVYDPYVQFCESLSTERLSDELDLSKLCSLPVTLEIKSELQSCMENIHKNNCPTAKLWLQYVNLVSLAKTFTMAERMGDWNLHLSCIQHIIPYFHSTGHNLYAKSAQLYLQDMIDLPNIMTSEEYEKYTKAGYFTIRRSNKFWSGNWTDMTIEQTLMRSMHSRGGITRGRGITESVVSSWINAMPASIHICNALEEFTEVKDESSEQHKDFRDSSIKANEKDTTALLKWFDEHPPFVVNDKIMSLATGVCGDENINCWKAREVDMELQKNTINQNFADVSYKRSRRIQPISAVQSGVKIGNTRIAINSTFIFQRMLRLRPSNEDLITYFHYELSPFPPALFDENGMRKVAITNFDIFVPVKTPTNLTFFYIIDGEWLLNHVTWHVQMNFAAIYNCYAEYIIRTYGTQVLVVFNLNNNYASEFPKFAEQLRTNAKYICDKVYFDVSKVATINSNKLLSNQENKNLFLTQLCEALQKSGIDCKLLGTMRSEELIDVDADKYIIDKTIQLSKEKNPISIVTNNADFLYTLTSMAPLDTEIYIQKVFKTDATLYSVNDQRKKYPHLYPYLFVLYALSGCFTTSAIFSIGKKTIFSLFQKSIVTDNVVASILQKFIDPTSTIDIIKEAGEQLMLLIYKAPKGVTTLNDLRCIAFYQLISKSKKEISLSHLPPTSEAAHQHCYRL